jgi:hypothetical protein
MPFVTIEPEDYVASAIKTVGMETFTYGHWRHKLMGYITGLMTFIMNRRTLSRLVLRLLKPIRDEYHRRNNLTDNF